VKTAVTLNTCERLNVFFSSGATASSGPGPPHYRGFTITLGRTPLDEWSARRRDLYVTTHNTHKRQTSMSSAEFKPAIPASERPQTHALDRAATGIGVLYNVVDKIYGDFLWSLLALLAACASIYGLKQSGLFCVNTTGNRNYLTLFTANVLYRMLIIRFHVRGTYCRELGVSISQPFVICIWDQEISNVMLANPSGRAV
jgi:hypothetical protein